MLVFVCFFLVLFHPIHIFVNVLTILAKRIPQNKEMYVKKEKQLEARKTLNCQILLRGRGPETLLPLRACQPLYNGQRAR
jgi:hypothetical protein